MPVSACLVVWIRIPNWSPHQAAGPDCAAGFSRTENLAISDELLKLG